VPLYTVEQTIIISAEKLENWPTVKITYQTAYGIALGIYNASVGGWASGCTVRSGAVTSSNRRSVSAVFSATVTAAHKTSALANANALTKTAFIATFNAANAAVGHNITVPTTASLTINPPANGAAIIPTPPPPRDPDGDASSMIIMVVVMAGVCIGLGMVAYCMRGTIEQAQAAEQQPAGGPGAAEHIARRSSDSRAQATQSMSLGAHRVAGHSAVAGNFPGA